jgi:histidinol-phosphatase (PHP family)
MNTGFTNYHGHCHYCDGKGSVAAYVEAAIERGMPAYGFSSHAPLPLDVLWTMKEAQLPDYVEEIEQVKKQYADQIEIYRGLEVDYITGMSGPSHERLQSARLDYTIGSVHFVDWFQDGRPWEVDGAHMRFLEGLDDIFHGDIQEAVERYFALTCQMVQQDPPDIVGHLDKIKIQNEDGSLFSENWDWYREAVEKCLLMIARKGLIVEINTRGIYKKKTTETYPSSWIIRHMKALEIPVMINADAHQPAEITECFEETAALLLESGYESCRVLWQGKWQDLELTPQGLIYAKP